MDKELKYKAIASDLFTPMSLLMKLHIRQEHIIMLESVQDGNKRGRYSIIACEPDIIWKCENGKAYNNDIEDTLPPFDSLRKLIAESKIDMPAETPPMATGIYGYMGYDMVKLMETLPDNNQDDIGMPDAIYMRPTLVIIFDNVADKCYITARGSNADGKIADILEVISQPTPQTKSCTKQHYNWSTNIDEAEYCNVVRKAKEYIVAGDIFQMVPSRRKWTDYPLSSTSLYRSLRNMNPSPYMFFAQLGDFTLIGSSPEILVKVEDDDVTIRPIAGTRRRGDNNAHDIALEAELLADGKEISEHLMLLDLGRNDVGRVASDKTVSVTDQMFIERYSHVMHIVSNVKGKLRSDKDAIDALIAGFPAGTVSGAPKIRAMEIIDELETVRRSFYSGTVGYFAPNGDMDTCITLRTCLLKDGKVYLQAGGGVVCDSDPLAEYQETEAKMQAIVRAVENSENYC